MTLAALSIAKATNIDLVIGDRILLLLVAMLPSKEATRIIGAGFVTLATTLLVVPIAPFVGMTLILDVDNFMSECCLLTNVIANAVASLVVARAEGEPDEVRLARSSRAELSSALRIKSTCVANGGRGWPARVNAA